MLAPWNLYPARNVDTNNHIEIECFNLLKHDGTIPLGLCCSKKRFPKSSTNAVLVELFYVYSGECPLLLSNKNRTSVKRRLDPFTGRWEIKTR